MIILDMMVNGDAQAFLEAEIMKGTESYDSTFDSPG